MTAIVELYEEMQHTPGDIVDHLQRLHDLVIETDAQVVVELGVARGASTSALLAGIEETGGRVWSVDIEIPEAGLLPALVEGHPQWTYTVADDLSVVDECPRPVDVLFVDSAHDYQHTLAELTAYAPLVRSGGCVVMHDSAHVPDILQAVRDYWGSLGIHELYEHCYGLYVRHV
jgi:predicted O-methyltransferase YrrM